METDPFPRSRSRILALLALWLGPGLIGAAALLAIGVLFGLMQLSVIGAGAIEVVRPLWAIVVIAMLVSVASSGAARLVVFAHASDGVERRRLIGPVFQICAGLGCLAWLALNL